MQIETCITVPPLQLLPAKSTPYPALRLSQLLSYNFRKGNGDHMLYIPQFTFLSLAS